MQRKDPQKLFRAVRLAPTCRGVPCIYCGHASIGPTAPELSRSLLAQSTADKPNAPRSYKLPIKKRTECQTLTPGHTPRAPRLQKRPVRLCVRTQTERPLRLQSVPERVMRLSIITEVESDLTAQLEKLKDTNSRLSRQLGRPRWKI